MTTEMSYQSLRCVLEYLEANKRIHIAARSPQLEKFEKSIPLRITNLQPEANSLRLNNIIYRLVTIRHGSASSLYEIELYNKFKIIRDTPKESQLYKKFVGTLLAHNEIHTTMLTFDRSYGKDIKEELPANFCVHTRQLYTVHQDFNNLISLIHPNSIPLKMIDFIYIANQNFDHPLLRTAKKMDILGGSVTWRQLRALSNKHLKLRGVTEMGATDFLKLIEAWIQDVRKTGSTLEMDCAQPVPYHIFQGIEEKYKVKPFKGSAQSDHTERDLYVIPIDQTSQLHILGPRRNTWVFFRMEVMNIGICAPKNLMRKLDNL